MDKQTRETPGGSNGETRLAYVLGVPLAENVVRQWPQMGEIVRGRDLIGKVEGNFEALTLEVGRRLRLDDIVVVEWSVNFGDGRVYRNVTSANWRTVKRSGSPTIGVSRSRLPTGERQ